MSRHGSTQPNKRRRTQQWRTPVDLGMSSTQALPSFDNIVTRVERLQPSTGRRYQSERALVPDVPGLPPDDESIGLDPDQSANDNAVESIIVVAEEPSAQPDKKGTKKQKSLASVSSQRENSNCRHPLTINLQQRPMVLWKEGFRDLYLDELIRWEGRGDSWRSGGAQCTDCIARKALIPAEGKFRCGDCFFPHMLCKECCIRRHRMLPFHLIQVRDIPIDQLRVAVLGHPATRPDFAGMPCRRSFFFCHTDSLDKIC